MNRSEGAKVWANVLSELARVEVTVQWERPAWRVRWQDGPTRQVLMDRAAALGAYRVAAALPFEQLRFARRDSPLAIALGWLAWGSPGSADRARQATAEVEAFCAATGYPQARFDDRVLGAADLLSRMGHGDITEMGALLTRATPPVTPRPPSIAPGPDLRGSITSYRWPAGGPPADLLGPTHRPLRDTANDQQVAVTCQHCGRPLDTDGPRRGRPAKFCSGACRTAAHRAHQRQPSTA
ncbi:MAG TPA: hypothetical protein VIC62_01310 [Nakamurella sp.]|jgi:hypothetical protein